jgi:hypothetical protein
MNTTTNTNTQTTADERRCFCPGDCNCQAPAWMFRTVFCGCKQHDA